MDQSVIQLQPLTYCHIIDRNSNITRVEVGPKKVVLQDNESIVAGPVDMIVLRPNTFVQIKDPVSKDSEGNLQYTEFGQVKNCFGRNEYRLYKDYLQPFPLYPGELLLKEVTELQIVSASEGVKLEALEDIEDGGIIRKAGTQWIVRGPLVYTPNIKEKVIAFEPAIIINKNCALELKAINDFVDSTGKQRKVGESWLYSKQGSYLPTIDEFAVKIVQGITITDVKCIHLIADTTFTDDYGILRKAGEEWLVTKELTSLHLLQPYEKLVVTKMATTLSSRQYAIVLNPYDDSTGTNLWGKRVLIKGERSFFLRPGEYLESGVQNFIILSEDEAILISAVEEFVDSTGIKRVPGAIWLYKGPGEYVPPVEVKVIEKRKAIPLHENEGIYVRDTRTGEVKAICGQSYLLQSHEELWEKELPFVFENLLALAATGKPYVPPKKINGTYVYTDEPDKSYKRDKTRVVIYQAFNNTAVQVYDYKQNKSRVVYGPNSVKLEPDEMFTLINLSAGVPKEEGLIKSLKMTLGPDFMKDRVVVETSDHASLTLDLTYIWHFETDPKFPSKMFVVKDFIGDTCKSIASRVRGAVSGITFEEFHHHSAQRIREAVFGVKDGEVRNELRFEANGLVISSVDITKVNVTDEETRKNLTKSINLAIEIATKNQETNAKYIAMKIDQQEDSVLNRVKLESNSESEKSRIEHLKLMSESLFLELKGQEVSVAKAMTEAQVIEALSEVKQSEIRAKITKFEVESDIDAINKRHKLEVELLKQRVQMEIKNAKDTCDIEITKFKTIMEAIGKDTIVALARAGPETKAKLLGGLGLKGYLLTDGKNPLNLLSSANGMMGGF